MQPFDKKVLENCISTLDSTTNTSKKSSSLPSLIQHRSISAESANKSNKPFPNDGEQKTIFDSRREPALGSKTYKYIASQRLESQNTSIVNEEGEGIAHNKNLYRENKQESLHESSLNGSKFVTLNDVYEDCYKKQSEALGQSKRSIFLAQLKLRHKSEDIRPYSIDCKLRKVERLDSEGDGRRTIELPQVAKGDAVSSSGRYCLLEGKFDLKPKVLRKLKVHKYSMLNMVQQRVFSNLKGMGENGNQEKRQDLNTSLRAGTEELKNSSENPTRTSSKLYNIFITRCGKDKKNGEENNANCSSHAGNNEGENEKIGSAQPPMQSKQFLRIPLLNVHKRDNGSTGKCFSAREASVEKKLSAPRSDGLSPIKIKRRRHRSNPFLLEDDSLHETTFNFKEAGKRPERKKFNPKTFFVKLVQCLRKMKKLKLTPEEVLNNKEVFSEFPYQKQNSKELIKAARVGDVLKVQQILQENGKYLVYDFDHVNIPKVYQTALHWAAKRDSDDVARILIEHGADVDAKDIAGRTPLYLAIQNNSISTLKLLLAHQAEPWSNEDSNYKELCGSNAEALYYITKAQQTNIKLVEYNSANDAEYFKKWYLSKTKYEDDYGTPYGCKCGKYSRAVWLRLPLH